MERASAYCIRLCDIYIYSKKANDSKNQLPITSPSSSASSSSPPLLAVAFCVDTETLDLQASDNLYDDLEKRTEIDDQQDNSCKNVGNIYDSVDSVPTKPQSLFASASQPTLLSPSAPEAAAAAAAVCSSIAADSVNSEADKQPNNSQVQLTTIDDPQNRVSTTVFNIYDSIDDVPTTSQTSFVSSPSSQPTPLPPSPPKAAAEASFSVVDADNVHIQSSDSHDYHHYAPMTSQCSSASSPSQPSLLPPSAPEAAAAAAAASSTVDADNVYLQPSNSVDDVPCFYQIDIVPNTKPNDSAYDNGSAAHTYDSIDDGSVISQSSSPSSASTPEATAASSTVDADNVYLQPINSVDDVPCFYQIDIEPNTKPNDSAYDNGSAAHTYDSIDDGSVISQSLSELTSSTSSASTPEAETTAASSTVNADNVYLQPINSVDDVPCFYQEPNTKPNNSAYDNGSAAHTYDSIDDGSVISQSSSELTSSTSSASTPEAAATTSYSVDTDGGYSNSIDDVPCLYELQPNTKPSDGPYANDLPNIEVGESEA